MVPRLLATAIALAGLAASAAAAPAERAITSFRSSDAALNLTIPVPGQAPDRSVRLSCVGPDVLIRIDMLRDVDVAAWLAEGPTMTLVVGGEPVRFALFDLSFDVYYGWVAALYYDGSGPADWLDRLATAAAVVALNPLDHFAFPATNEARAALEAFAG
ncbi:MAG: hypothetical protein IT534_13255 [Bauldia sp.]|nr:hypothetical protein [Bauldia sp.]